MVLAAPFKSHLPLFKPGHSVRVYSNQKEIELYLLPLLQSGCWNPPSPVAQFTPAFLSLPPTPNILRASSPELYFILFYFILFYIILFYYFATHNELQAE